LTKSTKFGSKIEVFATKSEQIELNRQENSKKNKTPIFKGVGIIKGFGVAEVFGVISRREVWDEW
jgi:hypothetical protein